MRTTGLRRTRWARWAGTFTGTALALALLPTGSAQGAHEFANPFGDRLYLVTLDGTGTAGGREPAPTARLLQRQDEVLAMSGAGKPVYRWTTALNGFAVELTRMEATRMAGLPGVARVEPSEVRKVAGGVAAALPAAAPPGPGTGGRGTVVGFVDTGIHPDSPVFADSGRLGRRPAGFSGRCQAGDGWSADDCSAKIVGARHYLAGFGEDRLRAAARRSAYDDVGHGTEVASVTAGNSDISALDGDRTLGRFSGVAPDARISVYKACWAAPDPADDGCSTADVVAAVDRAVADGVDVLTVAVTGSSELDTVDLALLGAAEADVAVVAAAGNGVPAAGHAVPWALTVGGTTGPVRTGRLTTGDGRSFPGVMTAPEGVGRARVVLGERIPAPGRRAEEARVCVPGSLDAARADGRIVVCERGQVGRVDKSAAVELADGVGMVLADTGPRTPPADFHAVPTVHLPRDVAEQLRSALRRDPGLQGRLVRTDQSVRRPRVLGASASGSPDALTVKPDVVGRGTGLLAASSPAATSARWSLVSGTSAATAQVAGMTARVRSEHPRWSAARVRSALMTSAGRVDPATSSLRQGAGLASASGATRPGLVLDVPATAYRRALEADRTDDLNLPSVLVTAGPGTTTVTREVTSTAGRALYYSSRASGFDAHRVRVTPAAIRIGPGETREFRIEITRLPGARPGPGSKVDSGWVAWRGADGTRVRLPVVIR